MYVIILEAHANEDARIVRHIQYLIDNSVQVYHLHFNSMDEPLASGPFNYCGEKGFRINFNSNYKNKIRSLNFLFYSLSNKIVKDSVEGLELLGIDSTMPSIIHVHDPILLPLSSNLIKNNFNNAKIVYDRHEFFENYPKSFGINIYSNLEKIYGKSVSGVVVVAESQKGFSEQLFPKAEIFTVPNFPRKKDYDPTIIDNKINSFDKDSMLNLVYIGGLGNKFSRDTDLILKIVREILNHNENARFIIGGKYCPLPLERELLDYSSKFKDRFQYIGAVPYRKRIEITEKAHIGFLFIKPNGGYWVKTSPNKVFEYLICGVLPVIRVDIDQMQEIDELCLNFGRETSEEEILSQVLQLIGDPKKIRDKMTRVRESSIKFTWESVAGRYIELYNSLLNPMVIKI